MIEKNQGVAGSGRVFGYDHTRHNFIEWDLTCAGRIAVMLVEHDSEEESHGSLTATRRDAMAVAAAENRKHNSQLRIAIADARRCHA